MLICLFPSIHYTSNYAVELCELFHIRGSASRHKHVLDQVIGVVPYPVVGIEEWFHMQLNVLEIVRMSEQSHTIGWDLLQSANIEGHFTGKISTYDALSRLPLNRSFWNSIPIIHSPSRASSISLVAIGQKPRKLYVKKETSPLLSRLLLNGSLWTSKPITYCSGTTIGT